MYKKCPKCGRLVSDADKVCQFCGCDLTFPPDYKGGQGQNNGGQFNGGPFNGGNYNGNNNGGNYNGGPFNGTDYYNRPPYGTNNNGNDAYANNDAFATDPYGKSRGVMALLAILLGPLGIQYFYIGKTMPGIVFLLVSLLSCGTLGTITYLLSLIQGILLFCMSNQEFTAKYTANPSSFPLF